MQDGLVTLGEVEAAAAALADVIRRTPLVRCGLGSPERPLSLKAESLQDTGSFKVRGAFNAVRSLTPEQRARGIVTHSSGNHAQAVARAAARYNTTCTVVMPRSAPSVKRAATEAAGASIVFVEPHEREEAVARIREASGAAYIPPFDDRRVIAGQGTVGLELLADCAEVAAVLVPVGGGGLISGVAVAVKEVSPATRVIGVEPELAGDLAEGFAAGRRVGWDPADTARTVADGLRVPAVGELNWLHIDALVDDVVTVTEDQIRAAMRAVVIETELPCEPSGAVAVAGFVRYADELPAGQAVAIVSGGNVEPQLLEQVRTNLGA